LAEQSADLILVDTALSRPDSVEFTRRIVAAAPGAAVVLFGVEDPRISAAAVQAGRPGRDPRRRDGSGDGGREGAAARAQPGGRARHGAGRCPQRLVGAQPGAPVGAAVSALASRTLRPATSSVPLQRGDAAGGPAPRCPGGAST
jgi:hypothetical protein